MGPHFAASPVLPVTVSKGAVSMQWEGVDFHAVLALESSNLKMLLPEPLRSTHRASVATATMLGGELLYPRKPSHPAMTLVPQAHTTWLGADGAWGRARAGAGADLPRKGCSLATGPARRASSALIPPSTIPENGQEAKQVSSWQVH